MKTIYATRGEFSPIVVRLINLTGLHKAADYYWIYNRSLSAPYHNSTHVDFMLQDLILMARATRMTMLELTVLTTAVIFHDFNHTAGHMTDSGNIAIAKDDYREFAHYAQTHSRTIAVVTALIDSTQFPYVPAFLNSSAMAEIDSWLKTSGALMDLNGLVDCIRDLDLMTIFHMLDAGTERDRCVSQYYGLYREIRVSKPDLTLEQFITGNAQFLRDAKFSTAYGGHRKEEFLEIANNLFSAHLTPAQIASNRTPGMVVRAGSTMP